MGEYNFKDIEKKWQDKWASDEIYKTSDKTDKPKYYILDMFPYPSGDGLHVGHPKGYIATDVYARQKMMQGYNVLHPMGWDAFGLPAENYAIKNKVHPKVAVEKNVKRFKEQLEKIGFTYDWSREVNTTDPEFYKWTQWTFLKMLEKGLAYESSEPVIWCPLCKTVLANEDLEGGRCERCDSEVERRPLRQWVLKITDYADRLLEGLDELDWEDSIKEQQRNWIGKSEGAEIEFLVPCDCCTQKPKDNEMGCVNDKKIKVFTTRPDTLFGCTYMVLSPEHSLIHEMESRIKNLDEVKKYIHEAAKKSDLERTDLAKDLPAPRPDQYFVYAILCDDESIYIGQTQDLQKRWREHLKGNGSQYTKTHKPQRIIHYEEFKSRKEAVKREHDLKTGFGRKWLKREFKAGRTRQAGKTGVEIRGLKAINPVNNEEIPIFIADYVLAHYGTGAIMSVPAHDERDFEFAKQYGIEIKEVVKPNVIPAHEPESNQEIPDSRLTDGQEARNAKEAYIGEGKNINSGFLDGLKTKEAKEKMIEWLEKEKLGKAEINYKLNDWVFSRQRYWGEPIPVIHCDKCGVVPVPVSDLPVTLPEIKKYEPTGTGESPLAAIYDWVNVDCPKCGGGAKRETNTMPQWAGSSWYYLRYIDPDNDKALVDKNKEKYWSPVDFYVGGAEHATRHLIYARFWHKFLFDIGVVNYEEPFKKLQHVGLIMAEDGRKMSKRWGNVINPDDVIEKYGADTLRLYEMFMGPFSQAIAWSTKSMEGSHRFLLKVWKIFEEKELYQCGGGKAHSGSSCGDTPKELINLFHKTIKKVTEDIEGFRFNTAISQMMIFINYASKLDAIPKGAMQKFLQLLAPFAPHFAEELWESLGNKKSIFLEEWPKYNPELIKEEEISLVVQVNGKVRENILVSVDIEEGEAKELALNNESIKKWTEDKDVLRVIFVKGKLINIVVK